MNELLSTSRIEDKSELQNHLWQQMCELQGTTFYTSKHLPYTYQIIGNEMFVSRKTKSITRASVNAALTKLLQCIRDGEAVSGPKKLGVFGASYIYPIFVAIGLINNWQRMIVKSWYRWYDVYISFCIIQRRWNLWRFSHHTVYVHWGHTWIIS